jgi:CMP-N,N'-diacetyllegionaminic acid synthase|tara:strand:- start:188 stop:889 length:702 start_codon:yes stop_codon:yes gene_type:complete
MVKKCFVVVPARYGSKSLPYKNLMEIGNTPLFQWSYDAGKYMGFDTFISTNDDEIIRICQERDMNYIRRPDELCRDESLDKDFLNHFVKYFKITQKDTAIVNFRPTSPLRSVLDLNKFKRLVMTANASIRSIEKSSFPVQKMWFKNSEGELENVLNSTVHDEPFNMPRQQLRSSYKQTGSFDSYLAGDIISGKINGNKILPFEQSSPLIDIDMQTDLDAARYLYSKNSQLFEY